MSLRYTASRYCRGDGMAGCFVLAVLGCWCERGTKARAGHLCLDAWHLSHMLDVLPWVQELLGQESGGTVWGRLPPASPEKPAGVRIRRAAGAARVWVVSVPHGLGGSTLSAGSCLQLELWVWSAWTWLRSGTRSWGERATGEREQVRGSQRWELWKGAGIQSRRGPTWKETCSEWNCCVCSELLGSLHFRWLELSSLH